jgi:hypothetical protein
MGKAVDKDVYKMEAGWDAHRSNAYSALAVMCIT